MEGHVKTIMPLTMGLHIGDGLGAGYGAGLAALIADTLATDEELIVIAVAEGDAGWSNQRWSPDGDLWLDLVERIRYSKSLWPGVEFIGMFWSQGEADAGPPSLAYTMVLSTPWPSRWSYRHPGHHDGPIHTLAITVREIAEYMDMPFVTFQMPPYWVGTNSHRIAIQNALRDVGTRFPYAASIDVTYLPEFDLDGVNYSATQHAELSYRFFCAWNTAN